MATDRVCLNCHHWFEVEPPKGNDAFVRSGICLKSTVVGSSDAPLSTSVKSALPITINSLLCDEDYGCIRFEYFE